MVKKHLILFIVFLIGSLKTSLVACDVECDVNPVGLTRIPVGNGQNIYTKSINLPSGETAYFAWEPIVNEERASQWRLYKNLTDRMVGDYFFPALILLRKGESDSQIQRVFNANPAHQQEFLKYAKAITNKNQLVAAVDAIKSGVVGMRVSVGNYVTYISKKPVTGFFPLPENNTLNQEMDLETYITSYQNLVMNLSSFPRRDVGQTKAYEHRGIFRNPWSLIRKDCPGVALLLHAYTAWAWSQEFPEFELVAVNPNDHLVMRTLFMDAFNADEMWVKSLSYYEKDPIKYELYSKKFLSNHYPLIWQGSEGDQGDCEILIKVSALKSRFP